MKRFLVITLAFLLGAPLAHAGLEVPSNGSQQSGIGDISGWFCNPGTYTYTIDNGPVGPLVYGTNRNDTLGPCGDANNGIIQQFNWNLIPTGQHTIRIFFNGQQIDQATFSSTNIGTEFLSGAGGSVSTVLAGRDVTLTWQQGQQNYVITSATQGGNFSLNTLIGNWIFSFQIGSVLFTEGYSLTHLQQTTNFLAIVGTDDIGGPVLGGETADISSEPFPYQFALLDPGSIICQFYVFNQLTQNTLEGIYIQYQTFSPGNCNTSSGSGPYPMTGLRVNAQVTSASSEQEQKDAVESMLFAEQADGAAENIRALADEMVRQLQQ